MMSFSQRISYVNFGLQVLFLDDKVATAVGMQDSQVTLCWLQVIRIFAIVPDLRNN